MGGRTKRFKSLYLTESDLAQLRELSGGDDSQTVAALIQLGSILYGLGFRFNGGCLHLAMTMFPRRVAKIRKIYAEKNVPQENESGAEGRTRH